MVLPLLPLLTLLLHLTLISKVSLAGQSMLVVVVPLCVTPKSSLPLLTALLLLK